MAGFIITLIFKLRFIVQSDRHSRALVFLALFGLPILPNPRRQLPTNTVDGANGDRHVIHFASVPATWPPGVERSAHAVL